MNKNEKYDSNYTYITHSAPLTKVVQYQYQAEVNSARKNYILVK